MLAWFWRLIGVRPPASAQATLARAVPAHADAVSAAPRSDAATSASAAAPPAYGLRRPLVGRSGSVEAFELQLPAATARRLADDVASASAAAHQMALLATAARLAAGGSRVMVGLPAQLLSREAVVAAVPAGTMLLLPNLGELPEAVSGALRARGVQLGVPDGPPVAHLMVDFVVLQAQTDGLDTVLLSAQRWRERWPQIKVVVLGLANAGEVEKALSAGAYLAAGALAGTAQLVPASRPLGSAAHRICELLNHLALDRDLNLLADAVRADVALAWRLLRYANSAAIGLAVPADSVERAVQVLGRGELVRWLSVQLLAAAEARQVSPALQQSALARGRLLETLARFSGRADPASAFTLGLLSYGEPLLQMTLADALAPLRLSADVNAALLQRRGPLADWLLLAEAVESGAAEAVQEVGARLGVEGAISAHTEAAWEWAAALSGPEA